MKLNIERISQGLISQLDNWEVLSVSIFVKKLLEKSDSYYQEEFDNICKTIFDNDHVLANKLLYVLFDKYHSEYSKRTAN